MDTSAKASSVAPSCSPELKYLQYWFYFFQSSVVHSSTARHMVALFLLCKQYGITDVYTIYIELPLMHHTTTIDGCSGQFLIWRSFGFRFQSGWEHARIQFWMQEQAIKVFCYTSITDMYLRRQNVRFYCCKYLSDTAPYKSEECSDSFTVGIEFWKHVCSCWFLHLSSNRLNSSPTIFACECANTLIFKNFLSSCECTAISPITLKYSGNCAQGVDMHEWTQRITYFTERTIQIIYWS